jgi:hypothetical protein
MKPSEIKQTIRELRLVQAGEIFETHHVRDVLIRAARLQCTLEACTDAVRYEHTQAVREFCLGWPGAENPPWKLDRTF